MDGGSGSIVIDKQTAEAYALAFRKIFDHCSQSSKIFEVGKTEDSIESSYRLERCRGCWSQLDSRRA